MGDVAGEAVDIIDQNRFKELLPRIVPKTVESRPCQYGAAPGLIPVSIDDRPPAAVSELLQFRNLRIDGMSLLLFLAGNACIESHPYRRRLFDHCSICLDLFVLDGTP